jgi:hypothetical protein
MPTTHPVQKNPVVPGKPLAQSDRLQRSVYLRAEALARHQQRLKINGKCGAHELEHRRH